MQNVTVVDHNNNVLLTPCSPARARLLLSEGKATVLRTNPFSIKLQEKTTMENNEQQSTPIESCREVSQNIDELIEKKRAEMAEFQKKEQAELTKVFRDRFDYESIGGTIFKSFDVDEVAFLSRTAIEIKRNDIHGVSIDSNGTGVVVHKETRTSAPEFTLKGVGATPFEAFDRLLENEDKIIAKLFMTVGSNNRKYVKNRKDANRVFLIRDGFQKANVSDLQDEIERHRILADVILVRDKVALTKNFNALDYDPITVADLKKTGIIASIWGMNIMLLSSLPKGLVVMLGANVELGVRTVREFRLKKLENSETEISCQMSLTIIDPRAVVVGAPEEQVDFKLKPHIMR
jgi:hypothetical protein